MTSSHADASHSDIQSVLDRRVEAVHRRDLEMLMSLYSDDIVYFDIIPPHRFVGADAIRGNFVRWFAEYQSDIEAGTKDLGIAVSGETAFAHMLHRDGGIRRSGQHVVVWVRSTVCLQRRDDRWLITHEHISFPMNPENWGAIIDLAP